MLVQFADYFCTRFFWRARRAASPSEVWSPDALPGLTPAVPTDITCVAGSLGGVGEGAEAGARSLVVDAAVPGVAIGMLVGMTMVDGTMGDGACGWATSMTTLSLSTTLEASSGFSLSEVSS